MKRKIGIIISIIVLLIIVFWFSGIIPKQIGKIYGIKYMKHNFPEMQLEYINIEWNKYYGDYIITFKDKENQNYSCIIGPKYFPISIGQGLFEIQNVYLERYKESTLIEQKIAVTTFIISGSDNKPFISSEDISLNNNMIDTFKEVMNSNLIQNKIKEQYPNVGNIELEVVENTEILKAIYICDNYSDKECIDITNKYVELFEKNIADVYNIDNISIVDFASISTQLIEK
ncbi:MAG: hypothetical protein E7170_03620 [Firmicutes bacterium]|nr:hypothetical protein [Bacillota bacterium]